jgi:hypothetical protein
MSSLIGNNMLAGGAGYVPPYTIDDSVRINDDDSAWLQKAYASSGNRRTWTYSCWTKRGEVDQQNDSLLSCDFGTRVSSIGFMGTGTGVLQMSDHTFSGGSYQTRVASTAVYRDPSAWYHIVVKYDTTESTDTDRVKLYINGEEITDLSQTTYPAEDYEGNINYGNDSRLTGIGKNTGTGDYYDGYIAEAYFIDGTALTPSSFGELNEGTNQWVPKEYTGSYGTNGFYLKFDSAALNTSFTDSSSNAFTITAGGDVHNSQTVKKVGASSINFDGTGDYLEVPDSSDWDFGSGSWTIEGWFYVTNWNTDSFIWNHYEDGNNYLGVRVISGGDLNVIARTTSGYTQNIDFTSVNLSTSTWTHLAIVRDTSAGNFVIYKDGVSVGTSADATAMANVTGTARINDDRKNSAYWTGYLDEFRVSDVARYTGTFTPSTTEFTSDSNTLLLIHSNWTGGLGADSSGNGNTFTMNNIVATDQVVDSPTNNFATMNPIASVAAGTASVISEGNLKIVFDSSGMQLTPGTIGVSSGKWYWEGYVVSKSGDTQYFGVMNSSSPVDVNIENINPGCSYMSDGQRKLNGSSSSYGDSYTTGDIIGVALNLDDNEVKFYKDNTVQDSGTAISITADTYVPVIGRGSSTSTWVYNFGSDSSFAANKTAQGNQDGNGKGDFYYTPPTGFLALCADNLPDPAIELPGENFNTIAYAGDGTSPRSFTGVGFQPDFVWSKNRSDTDNHHLFDSVRGALKGIQSSTTNQESSSPSSGYLTSFDSDGSTWQDGTSSGANYNINTELYVHWNWKAGTTFDPTSDGSIASATGKSNSAAGFSIVKYTAENAVKTIGHGLSQAPTLILQKTLVSGQWECYYLREDGSDGVLFLDQTGAGEAAGSGYWNDTNPTSSVFTVGTGSGTGGGTDDHIAYCFHSVEGYSKVGSYEGNAAADGAFVYTGFRPAFLIAKNSGASGKPWVMYDDKRDTYNEMYKQLVANDNAAANTSEGRLDFVSNGIKWRIGDSYHNDGSFIYIAFAANPFKYSNAR